MFLTACTPPCPIVRFMQMVRQLIIDIVGVLFHLELLCYHTRILGQPSQIIKPWNHFHPF